MFRHPSLRLRLNLLIAAVSALWLAFDVGRILTQAGPRARQETDSATRLVERFVKTQIAELDHSADPEPQLRELIDGMRGIRHARVGRVGDLAEAAMSASNTEIDARFPEWFGSFLGIRGTVRAMPVAVRGRAYGLIMVASDPSDEIAAIWQEAQARVLADVLFGVALIVAATLLARAALRPLERAGDELRRLSAGDYGPFAAPTGPREFREISEKIGVLGGALSDLQKENSRLFDQLLTVQDEERKAISRDLHDEIGPHLFGLRARAAILSGRLGADAPAAADAAAISEGVVSLQALNRRILSRLRPAALDDLGLIEALRTLVERWRGDRPDIGIELVGPDSIEGLDERESLAIYRFVQEALTNAFRHADARTISVTISRLAVEAADAPALAGLRIRVSDDGIGFSPKARPGLGLIGMRERVRALGGEARISAGPQGGTLAEAAF